MKLEPTTYFPFDANTVNVEFQNVIVTNFLTDPLMLENKVPVAASQESHSRIGLRTSSIKRHFYYINAGFTDVDFRAYENINNELLQCRNTSALTGPNLDDSRIFMSIPPFFQDPRGAGQIPNGITGPPVFALNFPSYHDLAHHCFHDKSNVKFTIANLGGFDHILPDVRLPRRRPFVPINVSLWYHVEIDRHVIPISYTITNTVTGLEVVTRRNINNSFIDVDATSIDGIMLNQARFRSYGLDGVIHGDPNNHEIIEVRINAMEMAYRVNDHLRIVIQFDFISYPFFGLLSMLYEILDGVDCYYTEGSHNWLDSRVDFNQDVV